VDVSIIIVNYNSYALTRQCIQSVQAHTKGVTYEIIVVDNASQDDTIIKVRQLFPSVQVISLPENIGFGRANNAGMAVAKGQYIFLLNPDTQLSGNSILSFFRYLNDPVNERVAVCGAALVDATGSPAMSYGNFPTLLGNFLSIGFHLFVRKYYAAKLDTGVAAKPGDRARLVDYVSGAAFFVRKKVLDEAGCFDGDFFLYFEETELCWRINKKGYMIAYLPEITITHYEGGTTAAYRQNGINPFSFYHYYRSKRLFYRKTKGLFSAYIYYAFDILHELNKSIISGRIRELSRKLRLMMKPVNPTSL
jgi:GT2 family glycosyltransferase